MKAMHRTLIRSFLISALFLASSNAHAAAPVFSLAFTSADAVQLRIQGDPRSAMKLQYTSGDGLDRTLALGTTDSDGFLSTTVSTSGNGIVPNSLVQVLSVATNSLSPARRWPFFGSTNIAFSASSVTVPVGQNTSIPITNPLSSPLMLKSNTNASAVAAAIRYGQLDVSALGNGLATLTVCVSDGTDCHDLAVTAGTGSPNGEGSLALSQTAPVLVAGHVASIYISGPGANYYLSSNSAPSIAQASVSQNLITISATSPGTTRMEACSPANACSAFTVSVLPETNTSSRAAIIASPSSVSVAVGERAPVLIAGRGIFTAVSNSFQTASTTLDQNTHLSVIGMAEGTATVQVCDGQNNCDYVSVRVTPARAPTTAPSPNPAPAPSGAAFTHLLTRGSSGAEVLKLQQKLVAQGYLKAKPNGYYGMQTIAAVKKLQKANGVTQTGYVGPGTRAVLNK